jgi:trehalose 6-phosphate phosphatase
MKLAEKDSSPMLSEPSDRLVVDGEWSLFLDVDGTLLDIAAAPELVVVPPDLPEVLVRISAALDGALALVSGRPIAQLDRLFAPVIFPAAGEHGAELRRGAGEPVVVATPPATLAPLRRRLAAAVAAVAGARLEVKRTGLVVHYRQAVGAERRLRRLVDEAVAAHAADLEVQPGKMVVEIKRAADSKGRAVAAFMRRAPFAKRRPLFVGDDAADREAFAAARAAGGCGAAVGPDHADAADWGFASPAAFRAWLARAAGRVS